MVAVRVTASEGALGACNAKADRPQCDSDDCSRQDPEARAHSHKTQHAVERFIDLADWAPPCSPSR